MKVLKYLLFGLAVLVVAVGVAIAYIAATFDPNQYKPQIVQTVKERTQRTLTLAGDIDLAFFPSVGARLGKATLSERGSAKEFAAVEDLLIAVKLWPLLSREIVVDAIDVKGLRAQLIRYKDGRTNFDDLAGVPATPPAPRKPEATQPVKIDIARIRIQDSAISYVDEQAGAKYEFTGVKARTGRIASGVPSDIEAAFHARGNEPSFDLATELKTQLRFDIEQKAFALHGLDLTARGAAAGVSELTAGARGDIEARLASNEFLASKFMVSAKGKREGGDLDARFEIPELAVTRDNVRGQRIAFNMTLGAAKRKVAARVEIPGLDGNAKAFAAKEFTASFDIEEDGSSTRVKLASPLAGSVERRQFELPRLAARLNLSSPRLPKGPIEATLNGALTVDAAKETANLTFATKLDESTINGRAGLAKFAPPSYTFDVDVDRLDADRYFPKTSEQKRAPGGGEPKGQGQGEEQPIDLAALRDVNASGTLKIGALKVSGLQTRNVRLDVKAANGTVDVNPIAANLYQGALAGALMIDAAKTPSFAIKQKLTGVDIGPLIRDLSGNDMLEGTGNVNVDVKTQGNTVSALKKGLNGNAAVRLTDGALKGINIAGAIRSVRAKLGALRGEQVQQSDRTQKTDFTELNATFTIRDGIAHNSDLEMKSPLLRASGEGDINIVDGTVDYLIKATIVATTKGQGGRDLADLQGVTVPVRVSGPLEDPSYKLDFAAIASDAAKKKIESTVREELERRLEGGAREGKPGGDLKDQLKGLFGR